jgi:nitronate monooxygenase
MSTPAALKNLRVPAIASPMFLVSGTRLVIETCKAGVVGTFPALNQRSSEGFEAWLNEIKGALGGQPGAAPYGVNLIVHKSNDRVEADLKLVVKHKVPVIITSLGAVRDVVDAVHSYGGLIFHDVIGARHAQKAIEAGVDGVIGVAAGAGGHAGTVNPFALVSELRQVIGPDKTLILAGAISNGADVAAARVMGADLAYLGTRFIATEESMAQDEYKQMIVDTQSKDIVYTPKISGINANFMAPSISRAGLDLQTLEKPAHVDMKEEAKAWKNIWSAGHGVADIRDIPPAGVLCARLKAEYDAALARVMAGR